MWRWKTPRKKKAPIRGKGNKVKKHVGKDGLFMKSTFLVPFSTKLGPDGSKNHKGADSNFKSIHFLLKKAMIIKDLLSYFLVKIVYFSIMVYIEQTFAEVKVELCFEG